MVTPERSVMEDSFWSDRLRGARGPGSEPDHPGVRPDTSSSASAYDSVEDYSWRSGEFRGEEEVLPLPPPQEFLEEIRALSLHSAPTGRCVAPVVARARDPPSSVALPPYRPNRPAAWFAAVEGIFRYKGVSDQRDQLTLALPSFAEEQLQQIDDIIELHPQPLDIFYRVRDRLVASHSLDDFQRLELLLDLPPLGGQKPSALLAQMRQLCPAGEETTKFFRAAFLRRLPPAIRLQLAEDRYSPVAALAARADTLMVHHSQQVVAAAPVETEDPVAAAAAAGGRSGGPGNKKKKHGGRRGGDPDKPRPWKKLGICYSHYTFGRDAIKCEEPCAWQSGN